MHRPPALRGRLLSLLYETLLLLAVLMVGALPFVALAPDAGRIAARPLFQLFLFALAGTYFIWQWLRGGQTLPMKTWRLRLATREGGALTLRHGVQRYLFALAGSLLFGAGFLWALAGTKIVQC